MLDIGFFATIPLGFKIFGAIVVTGLLFTWGSAIANMLKLRKSGINPLMAPAFLADKVLNSQLLAPTTSIEEKLAEIDRLFQNGTISADEHKSARIAAISGK